MSLIDVIGTRNFHAETPDTGTKLVVAESSKITGQLSEPHPLKL